MPNCPHCAKPIGSIKMVPMQGYSTNMTQWNCVAYTCPNCDTAISVDVDLTAVRHDIIAAIEAKQKRL
jgi:formate dehydrogenase maturation protein FdhE